MKYVTYLSNKTFFTFTLIHSSYPLNVKKKSSVMKLNDIIYKTSVIIPNVELQLPKMVPVENILRILSHGIHWHFTLVD